MTEQEINNLIDSKIGKTKMSQLPEATQTSGLYSIGYTGNQSVKYKANLLQGDPLTVRKTYSTLALANADKNPRDFETNEPLRVGQFIAITGGTGNGIYQLKSLAPDGTPTYEFVSALGDLSAYAKKSEVDNITISEDGTVKKDGVGVNIKTTTDRVVDGESGEIVVDILKNIESFAAGFKRIDLKIKPMLTPNKLIDSVGRLVDTTTTWSATEEYIHLNGSSSVFYNGKFGTSTTKIAFYSGVTIDSWIVSYPSGSETITQRDFVVPEGAKYVRVSCSTAFEPNFYLILNGFSNKRDEIIFPEVKLYSFTLIGSDFIYENGTVKESDIRWNDGSSGRVVYSDWDEDNATYKGFTATSIQNNKQITQPSVTFNSDGQITNYPQLIITSI